MSQIGEKLQKKPLILEYLAMFQGLPSGFRKSFLSKNPYNPQHHLESFLTPTINSSGLKLENILSSTSDTLSLFNWEINISNLKRVPLPANGLPIISRELKVAMLDIRSGQVISNITSIPIPKQNVKEKFDTIKMEKSEISARKAHELYTQIQSKTGEQAENLAYRSQPIEGTSMNNSYQVFRETGQKQNQLDEIQEEENSPNDENQLDDESGIPKSGKSNCSCHCHSVTSSKPTPCTHNQKSNVFQDLEDPDNPEDVQGDSTPVFTKFNQVHHSIKSNIVPRKPLSSWGPFAKSKSEWKNISVAGYWNTNQLESLSLVAPLKSLTNPRLLQSNAFQYDNSQQLSNDFHFFATKSLSTQVRKLLYNSYLHAASSELKQKLSALFKASQNIPGNFLSVSNNTRSLGKSSSAQQSLLLQPSIPYSELSTFEAKLTDIQPIQTQEISFRSSNFELYSFHGQKTISRHPMIGPSSAENTVVDYEASLSLNHPQIQIGHLRQEQPDELQQNNIDEELVIEKESVSKTLFGTQTVATDVHTHRVALDHPPNVDPQNHSTSNKDQQQKFNSTLDIKFQTNLTISTPFKLDEPTWEKINQTISGRNSLKGEKILQSESNKSQVLETYDSQSSLLQSSTPSFNRFNSSTFSLSGYAGGVTQLKLPRYEAKFDQIGMKNSLSTLPNYPPPSIEDIVLVFELCITLPAETFWDEKPNHAKSIPLHKYLHQRKVRTFSNGWSFLPLSSILSQTWTQQYATNQLQTGNSRSNQLPFSGFNMYTGIKRQDKSFPVRLPMFGGVPIDAFQALKQTKEPIFLFPQGLAPVSDLQHYSRKGFKQNLLSKLGKRSQDKLPELLLEITHKSSTNTYIDKIQPEMPLIFNSQTLPIVSLYRHLYFQLFYGILSKPSLQDDICDAPTLFQLQQLPLSFFNGTNISTAPMINVEPSHFSQPHQNSTSFQADMYQFSSSSIDKSSSSEHISLVVSVIRAIQQILQNPILSSTLLHLFSKLPVQKLINQLGVTNTESRIGVRPSSFLFPDTAEKQTLVPKKIHKGDKQKQKMEKKLGKMLGVAEKQDPKILALSSNPPLQIATADTTASISPASSHIGDQNSKDSIISALRLSNLQLEQLKERHSFLDSLDQIGLFYLIAHIFAPVFSLGYSQEPELLFCNEWPHADKLRLELRKVYNMNRISKNRDLPMDSTAMQTIVPYPNEVLPNIAQLFEIDINSRFGTFFLESCSQVNIPFTRFARNQSHLQAHLAVETFSSLIAPNHKIDGVIQSLQKRSKSSRPQQRGLNSTASSVNSTLQSSIPAYNQIDDQSDVQSENAPQGCHPHFSLNPLFDHSSIVNQVVESKLEVYLHLEALDSEELLSLEKENRTVLDSIFGPEPNDENEMQSPPVETTIITDAQKPTLCFHCYCVHMMSEQEICRLRTKKQEAEKVQQATLFAESDHQFNSPIHSEATPIQAHTPSSLKKQYAHGILPPRVKNSLKTSIETTSPVHFSVPFLFPKPFDISETIIDINYMFKNKRQSIHEPTSLFI